MKRFFEMPQTHSDSSSKIRFNIQHRRSHYKFPRSSFLDDSENSQQFLRGAQRFQQDRPPCVIKFLGNSFAFWDISGMRRRRRKRRRRKRRKWFSRSSLGTRTRLLLQSTPLPTLRNASWAQTWLVELSLTFVRIHWTGNWNHGNADALPVSPEPSRFKKPPSPPAPLRFSPMLNIINNY